MEYYGKHLDEVVRCPDCGYRGELREVGELAYQWCVVCCQEILLDIRDHGITFLYSDWLTDAPVSVSDWDYPLSWPEQLNWPLLD